jgi:hypothetical protein
MLRFGPTLVAARDMDIPVDEKFISFRRMCPVEASYRLETNIIVVL